MFKIYIKTAYRNLLANKSFTAINILGLAMGLAAFALIAFYIFDELSYDRYNEKADRIYRVNNDIKYSGAIESKAEAPAPMAASLVYNFPEIEKAVRIMPDGIIHIKKGDQLAMEDKVAYCDPGIFAVFTLPMIQGDPGTALADPNSVVITETMAKKYFNRIDVTGNTLVFVNDGNVSTPLKITGVIRDMPATSHFNFDFLRSMTSLPLSFSNDFATYSGFSTYLLLKTGANYQKLEAKFPALVKSNLKTIDFDYDAFAKNGNYIKMNLTPLRDIHLRSNRQSELSANGNMQYINTLGAIALAILLLACVNFMNLSTARSSKRAKEVGVRKVLGSSRISLITQFLSESLLVTLIAAMLAIGLAWLLMPWFNQLSGKALAITNPDLVVIVPAAVVVVIIVGGLTGWYPAFFLSAFKPVNVLKGKLATGFSGSGLRSILVVCQFAISIFLIIGTLVIYSQMHYIQNKDLGFNRDRVLVIKNVHLLNDVDVAFKEEVKHIPGVLNATLSTFLPTGTRKWPNALSKDEEATINGISTEFWPVDEDYLSTVGISLVQGRNFTPGLATDSSGILINEAAAKQLSFPDGPLNKILYYNHTKEYHIIGVVKDFNFSSLRDHVTPLVMTMMTSFERRIEVERADALSVKIKSNDLPALLKQMESKWKSFSPLQHFEYSFMDEDFDAIYRNEQRLGRIVFVFSALAIIIACLGLFGLSAYAAEQRNKEISIRKVLGADPASLVMLLSKDFIRLVIIAILIATPLAWLAMQHWLGDFAYRTDIHWSIFVIAGLAAVTIAFITTSFQSIKAANTNPVENL